MDKQEVIVTNVQMSFGSMISFMVKWAIAAIPAMMILWLISIIFLTFLRGLLGLL